MDKKDEKDELEGLRADDGSQPVTKGVKIVEYNRKDSDTIAYAGMVLLHRNPEKNRKRYPMQKQNIRDKKSEKETVIEKTKKGTAASTTAGKKGGRKK